MYYRMITTVKLVNICDHTYLQNFFSWWELLRKLLYEQLSNIQYNSAQCSWSLLCDASLNGLLRPRLEQRTRKCQEVGNPLKSSPAFPGLGITVLLKGTYLPGGYTELGLDLSCLYNCQFDDSIDPKVITFFLIPLASFLNSNNLEIILLFLFVLSCGQARWL